MSFDYLNQFGLPLILTTTCLYIQTSKPPFFHLRKVRLNFYFLFFVLLNEFYYIKSILKHIWYIYFVTFFLKDNKTCSAKANYFWKFVKLFRIHFRFFVYTRNNYFYSMFSAKEFCSTILKNYLAYKLKVTGFDWLFMSYPLAFSLCHLIILC